VSGLDDNRLVRTFADLRGAGAKTLLPFITAGFPDLETTAWLLKDFEARGVRICELGIPFSDPIADGPVIQSSYTHALGAGVTSKNVFETVRGYRDEGGEMSLVAMVSYSIVYANDVEAFLGVAREAGFDAVIIPDLSLEEAAGVERLASDNGLCNVMLIAPTTGPRRRLEIAKHSRGFLYFISVAGITGERKTLPAQTARSVEELRGHVRTPICVGFGISSPQMVAEVCRVADGAIVGSAIVHRLEDAKSAGASVDEMVRQVGAFVGELISPLV